MSASRGRGDDLAGRARTFARHHALVNHRRQAPVPRQTQTALHGRYPQAYLTRLGFG
jgi:hypothetical protein